VKKPTHAFAAIVWIAAILLTATEIPLVVLSWKIARSQLQVGDPFYSAANLAFEASRSVLIWIVPIAALGFIVDLLDHLRWLATPADERGALRDRYLFQKWRRSRVS
jgi:hypothetical protein